MRCHDAAITLPPAKMPPYFIARAAGCLRFSGYYFADTLMLLPASVTRVSICHIACHYAAAIDAAMLAVTRRHVDERFFFRFSAESCRLLSALLMPPPRRRRRLCRLAGFTRRQLDRYDAADADADAAVAAVDAARYYAAA